MVFSSFFFSFLFFSLFPLVSLLSLSLFFFFILILTLKSTENGLESGDLCEIARQLSEKIDLVISLGGDGTLLRACSMFRAEVFGFFFCCALVLVCGGGFVNLVL